MHLKPSVKNVKCKNGGVGEKLLIGDIKINNVLILIYINIFNK